ncbi:MAG TPA: cysteine desulfurase [Saprospiraceae bacterium]|nr:cysteine desulfurase [Saprospiraceae bacterium]
MKRIYLDYAATTPVDTEVLALMTQIWQDDFGNPSSIYAEGRKARMIIENARKTIAHGLNASIGEIFFTSCGTEGNNMAIKNAVRDLGVEVIISAPTEHHSVWHSLLAVERDYGVEVIYLDVDDKGRIDIVQLKSLLETTTRKVLVSLMYVNNELGTIHPIQAIADLAKAHGAYFHTDAVQAVGSYDIDVQATPISFLTCSAHKFHGPKGVGFIYINGNNIIKPLLDGGAQERNMRSGTENTAQIAGLALAFRKALDSRKERMAHISQLRTYLKNKLTEMIPDVQFHGDEQGLQHPKILSISLPENAKTEILLFNLDIHGICASGGSACSSGVESASHVLEAIGLPENRRALRVSLSHLTTLEELDRFVDVLLKVKG